MNTIPIYIAMLVTTSDDDTYALAAAGGTKEEMRARLRDLVREAWDDFWELEGEDREMPDTIARAIAELNAHAEGYTRREVICTTQVVTLPAQEDATT